MFPPPEPEAKAEAERQIRLILNPPTAEVGQTYTFHGFRFEVLRRMLERAGEELGPWRIESLLERIRKRAFEMLFTGEFIDARTALAWGLVNRVVPVDQLMPTAKEMAKN